MREASDFTRHHREAATLLAGTRCFDRSVERENVGLEGDAVDDANDVDDLLARRGDGFHRGDDLAHDHAAFGRDGAGRARQLSRLARGVGVVLHRRRELLHRGGGLLQVGRLLFGALAQVGVAGGDLARPGRDAVAALTTLADDHGEAVAHRFHAGQQARLVAFAQLHVDGQVAGSNFTRHARCIVGLAAELTGDRAGQPPGDRRADAHAGQADNQHQRAGGHDVVLDLDAARLDELLLQRGDFHDPLLQHIERRQRLGEHQLRRFIALAFGDHLVDLAERRDISDARLLDAGEDLLAFGRVHELVERLQRLADLLLVAIDSLVDLGHSDLVGDEQQLERAACVGAGRGVDRRRGIGLDPVLGDDLVAQFADADKAHDGQRDHDRGECEHGGKAGAEPGAECHVLQDVHCGSSTARWFGPSLGSMPCERRRAYGFSAGTAPALQLMKCKSHEALRKLDGREKPEALDSEASVCEPMRIRTNGAQRPGFLPKSASRCRRSSAPSRRHHDQRRAQGSQRDQPPDRRDRQPRRGLDFQFGDHRQQRAGGQAEALIEQGVEAGERRDCADPGQHVSG